MVLGFVAEVIAWSLVARRAGRVDHDDAGARHDGRGRAGGRSDRVVARRGGRGLAPVGLGLGVLLYVATRIAMVIMARWGTFRRHSLEMYRKQGGLSLGIALLLSIALSVPGEELFWRGFFQGQLASSLEGRAAPRRCSRGSRSCWRTSQREPGDRGRRRGGRRRLGRRWRGGPAGCSRASPATSCGRG